MLNQLGDKAPKANPTLTGAVNMNTIDAIPNAANIKPDLNVLQNLKVGTGLAPKNLTVLGDSNIVENLGVIGVTILGDGQSWISWSSGIRIQQRLTRIW